MNTCSSTGKVCYSERDAGALINKYKKHKGRFASKKRPVRKYRCNMCNCWHVTSMAFITDDVKEFYKKQKKELV